MTRKRSSKSQGPTGGQRVTIGTVTGLVVIGIVLIAQYVFNIDLLNLEPEATSPAPVASPAATAAPTTAPTPFPTLALTPVSTSPGTPVASIPGGEAVPIPGGIDGGWYQLYFTAPINTRDETRFTGSPVEAALVNAIDNATSTIDLAVYQMDSRAVTDALLRAHQRGIQIRIVTDDEFGLESPNSTIEELEFEGIPVRSDAPRRAFMHNKFFIIDGLYVWTGSTNITHNGFYNNNNSSILIRSRQLAENFQAEFDEMWAGQYGSTSPNNLPNPVITVNGTRIETFFESEGSPSWAAYPSDPVDRLSELVRSARTVRFMAFVITREDLMTVLVEQAAAGVLDVRGIVERSQRRFVAPMFCAGLEIRQDGNPDILHHKVFIIDDTTVAFGSFNFTGSATNNNDENMLILFNRDIAQAFLEEFARRWAEAEPLPPEAFTC